MALKRWNLKIDDQTHARLLAIQRPREDQGDIVKRLLDLWDDSVEVLRRVTPIRPDPIPRSEVIGASQKPD